MQSRYTRKRSFLYNLLLLSLLLLRPATTAQAYTVPPKLKWWYEARFGMFIHFGSYSEAGHGEWYFRFQNWKKADYQTQVSANFNPVNFDARAIVSAAKNAGMKYLVITAKHHEGFAMWDSKVASFTDTTGAKLYTLPAYAGFKRDVLGELKAECDKQGIAFCLYYSILDWNHPSQVIRTEGPVFSTMASEAARAAYIVDMKAQLKELITKYDPALIWFDGDWCKDVTPPTLENWWSKKDGLDLYNYLIALKPTLVINERVKRNCGLGDYLCAEGEVPKSPLKQPWETCQTMNHAWGYDSSRENEYKSAKSMIQELVRVVSRDGNYLLNIGPKGDGSVSPGAMNVLSGFADWMKSSSESVHGVTASPFKTEPTWGYYTKKDGKLYVHIFSWPETGKLEIPSLKNSIGRVYALEAPTVDLKAIKRDHAVEIELPLSAPNAADSVLVVEVLGTPEA